MRLGRSSNQPSHNLAPAASVPPDFEKSSRSLLEEWVGGNVPDEWRRMFSSIMVAFNHSSSLPPTEQHEVIESIYSYAGRKGNMPGGVVQLLGDRASGTPPHNWLNRDERAILKALDELEQESKGE